MSNKESAEKLSALSISFWVFVSSSLPSSLQPAYFSHLQNRIAHGYIPAHHPGPLASPKPPRALTAFLQYLSCSRCLVYTFHLRLSRAVKSEIINRKSSIINSFSLVLPAPFLL